MSAKSLGTLPVIYAVDTQQNPLPVKQCCVEGIQIALKGKIMSFQVAKGFGYRFNIVYRGKGTHNCYFCSEKGRG